MKIAVVLAFLVSTMAPTAALAQRANLGGGSGGAALEYGFHHVQFTVGDLEASIAWYERVLGFKVLERAKVGGNRAAAQLINGSLHVELFQADNPAPAPEMDTSTPGIKHMAFVVKDVEAFVAELRKRGCEIVRVMKSPLGVPLAFIKDNSGNTIELIQPLAGDPPF